MPSVCCKPRPKRQSIDSPLYQGQVIILAGPTAVGKTALSLLLAQTLAKSEILSADSAQVYRGMDIGTAKISWRDRQKTPHHLIDIREIDEPFNVVDFFVCAKTAIQEIFKRGGTPIVVGGAGFYLRTLLQGPPSGPPSVPLLRRQLEAECDRLGTEAMLERLSSKDPEYAATISTGDKQKIVRGLEIIALTNQPVSAFCKTSEPLPWSTKCFFLHKPRETLYQDVETRCELMLRDGLIDEVARLKKQGLLRNTSASQSIGYRQTLHFLETPQTPSDYAEFLTEFKTASRRLVKRQFTWFRNEPDFTWLNLADLTDEEAVSKILQSI